MTHLKSVGIIRRNIWNYLANKDNSSFVFSIIAIALSVGGFWYSIYQGDVDVSRERYEFWTHVNGSLERQEALDMEIYPLLFTQVVQSKTVLRGIRGDELKCSYLVSVRRNKLSLKRMLSNISSSAFLGKLENSEKHGLPNVILENGNLAEALSVNGWNRFLVDDNYSNKWWTKLSWDTMQLGFIPGEWDFKCAGTGKKKVAEIKISSQALGTFRADVQTAILDDTYIQEHLTPNIVALKNLEAENMPTPYVIYGSFDSIFGPLNKNNVKNNDPLNLMVHTTSLLNGIVASVYAKEGVAKN